MQHRVLAASAVFGTLLLTACATSTTPGSAYNGTATPVLAGMAPSTPAPGMSSSASTSAAVLTVKKTPIGYLLANANGYTVYWFAKDHPGRAHPACAGRCLLAWFPVTGQPVAAKGVTLDAKLSCVARAGGVMQATYNGYPLYTFGSDSAPGMANGNGSAGVWHVIREKAPATSGMSGSGG
jgi:predicted lipoprotein with Yx(FWY)xxD motif